MKRTLTCITLWCLAGVLACRGAQQPPPTASVRTAVPAVNPLTFLADSGEYRGLLQPADGGWDFTPCSVAGEDVHPWAASFGERAWRELNGLLAGEQPAAVFVRLRGSREPLDPPPPALSAYSTFLAVAAVLEARPATPADCREQSR